jgi:hypothetical protein
MTEGQQQIQIGRRVNNQVHALLEINMIEHELDDMADIFGVKGIKNFLKYNYQDMT